MEVQLFPIKATSRPPVHIILHPCLQWYLVPLIPGLPGSPPLPSPFQVKFQLLPLCLCHSFTFQLPKSCTHLSPAVVPPFLFFMRFCGGTEINTYSQHHVQSDPQSCCGFSRSIIVLYSNQLTFNLISFKRIISSLVLETGFCIFQKSQSRAHGRYSLNSFF